MEQTEEMSINDPNSSDRNGEERFSWEEWTVIDERQVVNNSTVSQPVDREDGSSSDTSYSEIGNTSDAEEARESIRVLSSKKFEIHNSELLHHNNDESDGVSVITESESDAPFVNLNENKIVVYKSITHRVEQNSKNIFKEVTTCVNLLIACSMIVAIGIGVGMKFYGKHSISSEIDCQTIKMENDKLVEQMKELSSVKEILEEIKINLIQQRIQDSTQFQSPTRDETEHLPYSNKHFKSLHSSFNDSGTTLFERLQIFFRTICLVLEDIRQLDTKVARHLICDTHSFLTELTGLRILLSSVIAEMDDSTKTTNERFLEYVELQMRSMSESLSSDLKRTLDKLNVKNQRKVGKIIYKLNERLCMLRKTMPRDSKVRLFLEVNNTFVENCEKIVMGKFDKGKKQKWKSDSSTISESSNIKRKKAKIRCDQADSTNSYEKSRVDELNRQNETKSYSMLSAYRKNAWKTRKCYKSHNFVPDSKIMEDACSMLLAPPRLTSKSTRKQSFSQPSVLVDEAKNDQTKIGRTVTAKESCDKLRLKGDQISSKYLKMKIAQFQEFDQPINKPNFFLYEKNDIDTMRKMPTKTNPNSFLTPPQDINSDIKYERKFPTKPTVQRMKQRLGKENNEPERSEENENVRDNGHWQFERSRIRNQLRKGGSTDNWYFNRVVNRKSSRINHDESDEL